MWQRRSPVCTCRSSLCECREKPDPDQSDRWGPWGPLFLLKTLLPNIKLIKCLKFQIKNQFKLCFFTFLKKQHEFWLDQISTQTVEHFLYWSSVRDQKLRLELLNRLTISFFFSRNFQSVLYRIKPSVSSITTKQKVWFVFQSCHH